MERELSLLNKMIPFSAHKCQPSAFEGSLNMCHAVTCHTVTGQYWASLRAICCNVLFSYITNIVDNSNK